MIRTFNSPLGILTYKFPVQGNTRHTIRQAPPLLTQPITLNSSPQDEVKFPAPYLREIRVVTLPVPGLSTCYNVFYVANDVISAQPHHVTEHPCHCFQPLRLLMSTHILPSWGYCVHRCSKRRIEDTLPEVELLNHMVTLFSVFVFSEPSHYFQNG